MLPTTLPAISHYRGDLWRDGYRHFGPMSDEDGDPPAPECAGVRMVFNTEKTDELAYELNNDPGTDQGTIVIVNAQAYEFDIPDQALPLAIGTYTWALKTYLQSDYSDPPITWFTGLIHIK